MKVIDFSLSLKSYEEGMEKEWFGSYKLEICKKFKVTKASKVLFNLTIIDLVPIMFQKLWAEDK